MTILANRNTETGIRYGVIPSNDLFNAGEQFYDDADDTRHEQYITDAKQKLRHAIESAMDDFGVKSDHIQLAADEAFDILEQDLNDRYESDGTGLHYDDGEYIIDKLDETDLFVAKSPYFTFAPECSPCAPGACYLRNGIKLTDGVPEQYSPGQLEDVRNPYPNRDLHKTYCLGHEWFEEDHPAPYAIYSVETGKLIPPED